MFDDSVDSSLGNSARKAIGILNNGIERSSWSLEFVSSNICSIDEMRLSSLGILRRTRASPLLWEAMIGQESR